VAVERPPAWDDGWALAWDRHRTGDDAVRPDLVPCRVVRIDKGGITVATKPGVERLVVAAKAARRVVVGDVCGLDATAGRIESIVPRRTVFERRSPGVNRDEVRLEARPVAANMDTVVVLQPLDGGVNLQRLSRELVLAWESGGEPLVVLTKSDLVDTATVAAQLHDARRFAPGVEVHAVTTAHPGGVAPLTDRTGPGRVLALLGASGAGKSTLANALAGREVQLTAEVRAGDRRGRHTTSAGQMIPLAAGAWLIDTPGIRGVGLWAADEGLERAFADLVPAAEHCRFDDCTHHDEPGCGVRTAVEAGTVAADRLEAYLTLVDELEDLEGDLEVRARELEKQDNQRSRRRARRRDAAGP
jgi:ribosome biogenesis GTPase / thiamine phosphate phosphatase